MCQFHTRCAYKPDIYRCIRSGCDRLVFFVDIRLFFGTYLLYFRQKGNILGIDNYVQQLSLSDVKVCMVEWWNNKRWYCSWHCPYSVLFLFLFIANLWTIYQRWGVRFYFPFRFLWDSHSLTLSLCVYLYMNHMFHTPGYTIGRKVINSWVGGGVGVGWVAGEGVELREVGR